VDTTQLRHANRIDRREHSQRFRLTPVNGLKSFRLSDRRIAILICRKAVSADCFRILIVIAELPTGEAATLTWGPGL
jgi:hypothetical protein